MKKYGVIFLLTLSLHVMTMDHPIDEQAEKQKKEHRQKLDEAALRAQSNYPKAEQFIMQQMAQHVSTSPSGELPKGATRHHLVPPIVPYIGYHD